MKFAEDVGIDDGDFENRWTQANPRGSLQHGFGRFPWGSIGMKVYGL
jgi:hypothetical protein